MHRVKRPSKYRYGSTTSARATDSDEDGGGRARPRELCCAGFSVLLVVVVVLVALYLTDAFPGETSPLDPPEPPPYTPPQGNNGTLIPLAVLALDYAPNCAVAMPGTTWAYVCDVTNRALELYVVGGATGAWMYQNYSVPSLSTNSAPQIVLAGDTDNVLFVAYEGYGVAAYALNPSDGSLSLLNLVSYSRTVAAMAYDPRTGSLFVADALALQIDVYDNWGVGYGFIYQSSTSTPVGNTALVVVNGSLYGVTPNYLTQWRIVDPSQANETLGAPAYFFTNDTDVQGHQTQLLVSGDQRTLYVMGDTYYAGVQAWAILPPTGALALAQEGVDVISLCAPVGPSQQVYLANETGVTQLDASTNPLTPSGVAASVGSSGCALIVIYEQLVSLVDKSGGTITTWGIAPVY
jgi:hypothetical protein